LEFQKLIPSPRWVTTSAFAPVSGGDVNLLMRMHQHRKTPNKLDALLLNHERR
jgi:hypothetical protein